MGKGRGKGAKKKSVDSKAANGSGAPAAPAPQNVAILEKLQALAPEEREAACSSISHICLEGPESVRALLSGGCIQRLLPRLFDEQRPVRTAAFGALRNLSLVGKEVCSELAANDVINSVVEMLKKSAVDIANTDTSTEESQETVAMLTQAFALLWNLCESSPQVTEALSKQTDVHAIAIEAFLSKQFPLNFRVTIGHFLTVATDENSAPELLAGPINHANTISRLSQLALSPFPEQNSTNHALLSAQAMCILFNLHNSSPLATTSNGDSAEIAIVRGVCECVTKVFACVDVTGNSLALAVAALVEESRKKAVTAGAEIVLNDPTEDPVAVEHWKFNLVALQLCFETVANILTSAEAESDDDGNDDMDDDNNVPESPEVLPEPHQIEALRSVISGILASLSPSLFPNPPTNEAEQAIQRQLNSHFQTLQIRALTCLTNALVLFGTQGLCEQITTTTQQPQTPFQLWEAVWKICISSCAQQWPPSQIAQNCLQTLWTMTKKSNSKQGALVWDVPAECLEIVCKGADDQACDQEIRIVCAGLLGALGTRPYHEVLHRGIAQVLAKSLKDEPSVLVVCEAINSIFDVFAEPEYNQPFVEFGIMGQLKNLCSTLIKRAKQQMLRGDERAHVKETIENVRRFIDYKKQQGIA